MTVRERFWILVILGYLLVPLALLGVGFDSEAIENRALTPLPELSKESIADASFFSQLETVIDERNPLRPKAVEAAAWIDLVVLGQSSNEKVLLGTEDPWLYLADSLDQPCNFSGSDKSDTADRVERMVESLTARGTSLIWTIAPNKATIYPEYVADRDQGLLECALASSADLRSNISGVPGYLDLFPVFGDRLRDQPDELLYFPHDSHWNDLGAFLWYEQIIAEIDPSLLEAIVVTQGQTERIGDVTTLLGRPLTVLSPSLTVDLPSSNVERTVTPVPGSLAIRSSTASNPNVSLVPGTTVIIHDSFGNPTTDWYQLTFEDVTLVHWNSYEPQRFAELFASADRVIIEVVERGAYNRLTNQFGSDATWNAYNAIADS